MTPSANAKSSSSYEHAQAVSAVDVVATGAGVGAVYGAFFLCVDMLVHHNAMPASEASQLVLWFAGFGALLGMPMMAGLVFLARLINPRPGLSALVAVACGLAAQIVFLKTMTGRQLLATVPVPWLLAWTMYRFNDTRGANVLKRGLAVVAAAAWLVPLIVAFGLTSQGAMVRMGAIAVALAIVYLAQRQSLARCFAVLGVQVIMLIGIQFLGTASPAWSSYAKTEDAKIANAKTVGQQGGERLSPNIVMIVLDTTRRDHFGCYGDDRGLTPVVDKIASEGVVYEDMISTSPWTVPSHASLFTGLFPQTHGCSFEHHRWLDGGFLTLAEMLGASGYQTVSLVGNVYLKNSNQLQGFADHLETWDRVRGSAFHDMLMKLGGPAKWADHGVIETGQVLREWFDNKYDAKKPFFLFINLMEAHWPLYPPMAWRQKHLPSCAGYVSATRASGRFYGPHWLAGESHSKCDADCIRAMYTGSVAYQDHELQHVIDLISNRVDLDDTLLIVTADHGENLGEADRWDHVFAVNDHLIHVPFIVRYPKQFPAGTRVKGMCQTVDVVPTIFDVLGHGRTMEGLPGRSMLPAQFEPRNHAFAQVHPYYGHLERMAGVVGLRKDTGGFTSHLRCVRSDQYKFVWSSDGKHQLYDLPFDPDEATNILDKEPEIGEKLLAVLVKQWTLQPDYVSRGNDDAASFSAEELRKLRSLGYLGD